MDKDYAIIGILFLVLGVWLVAFPVLNPNVIYSNMEEVKYSECEFNGAKNRLPTIGRHIGRTTYLYTCKGKDEWLGVTPENIESNPDKIFRRHK